MSTYVIIEDDNYTINKVKSIVGSNFSDIAFLGCAASIVTAVDLIKTAEPDFVFLDVNLVDGESFDILKQFPVPNFRVIFVTSYSKYAVEAFKFSALDFILKPFDTNDIIDAVKKIIAEQNKENYLRKIETFFYNYKNIDKKRLVLKNLDKVHVVNIDDIIYVKSDNNYSTFYLKDVKKIVVSKTIKSFEEKLKGLHFLRSHQSYLVNLNYIQSFDKKNDTIILSDNSNIPISQSKRHFLIDFLNQLN